MQPHLEPYRVGYTCGPGYWFATGPNGGRRDRDMGVMYPLWQRRGPGVCGPKWLVDCFLGEFTRFWSNVIEWTEDGRN